MNVLHDALNYLEIENEVLSTIMEEYSHHFKYNCRLDTAVFPEPLRPKSPKASHLTFINGQVNSLRAFRPLKDFETPLSYSSIIDHPKKKI